MAPLGFLYSLGKDLKKYLEWKEEEKTVNSNYLEVSGLNKRMEETGYKLRWSNRENVETKLLEKYEIAWEIDKKNRIRRKLVNKGDQVLLAKKKN